MQISKQQQRKRDKLIEGLKEKARGGSMYALAKLEDTFGITGDNFAFLSDGGDPPYSETFK